MTRILVTVLLCGAVGSAVAGDFYLQITRHGGDPITGQIHVYWRADPADAWIGADPVPYTSGWLHYIAADDKQYTFMGEVYYSIPPTFSAWSTPTWGAVGGNLELHIEYDEAQTPPK